MKKHLIIVAFLLPSMFPSMFIAPCAYAGWQKLESTASGTGFYIDIDTATTPEGYIHYWELVDFAEALETGILSIKSYYQADCTLFRHRSLRGGVARKPMGEGIGEGSMTQQPQWQTPPAGSMSAKILKIVCKR